MRGILIKGVRYNKSMNTDFKIQSFKAKKEITIEFDLDTRQLEEDVYLFRKRSRVVSSDLQKESSFNPGQGFDFSSARSGFVDQKGLHALIAGEDFDALDLRPIPLQALEGFRVNGFHKMIDEIAPLLRKDVWEMMDEDRSLDVSNLVEFDLGNYVAKDWKGRYIPMTLNCGYISARIFEGEYDLAKLAEYLLAREDVVVYQNMGRFNEKPAQTIREAITGIPSYNAQPGESETVEFKWIPDQENYQRLADHLICNKSSVSPNGMIKDLIKLDILGLNAFKRPAPRRRHSP